MFDMVLPWPHLLPMFGNPDFFSISLDLQDMLKIRTAGSKLCSEAQRGILESAALGASEDELIDSGRFGKQNQDGQLTSP